MTTYSTENYSVKAPDGYNMKLSKNALDSVDTLSITKEGNRKLVIFRAKDGRYGEGGVRVGATQAEIDQEVPKKRLIIGSGEKTYDVWVYYNKDDAVAESELKAIFDSIDLK